MHGKSLNNNHLLATSLAIAHSGRRRGDSRMDCSLYPVSGSAYRLEFAAAQVARDERHVRWMTQQFHTVIDPYTMSVTGPEFKMARSACKFARRNAYH